ncbi:MAG: TetR/AcrR family transcriptional regulator [Bacteroidia bacterium]
MTINISHDINSNLFVKNPSDTELGRKIVGKGLQLVHKLGIENFNFKKLAENINTTEASVYRYFKDKHQFVLYLNAWYWRYILFLVEFELKSEQKPIDKLNTVLSILYNKQKFKFKSEILDILLLRELMLSESVRLIYTQNIESINKQNLLSDQIKYLEIVKDIIKNINPKIKFPLAIATTMVESIQIQHHLISHGLPLTDIPSNESKYISNYLESFFIHNIE